MAVNCYLTLATASSGTLTFYPELPIGREIIIISEDKRMLNGQMRRAYRAFKYRFTFTLRDATETERNAWYTAATGSLAASATYTDETNTARTVLVTSIRDDLSRTTPTVEGSSSTTGSGFFDLEVVVEEV